jgi:hypothetical protein
VKISPPKVIVDEHDPFKDALFGRKDFAESLTGLLKNVDENLVIVVNAPFGEGKTTFAHMWHAHLLGQKFEVIYFDAYAADYFDDSFVSFSGEILAFVDKHLPRVKDLADPRKEFKKTAVEVAKRLTGLAVKVGLRAATMGAIESAHMAELREIGSEIASGVSEIGADIIEKKIENYAAEKDALAGFKESLAKLAAAIRKEQGFPLTIIVDELDRCRPDFALGLLERIKHLFDVEGVAFVLLVNQDQIESYIRAVYGENVDARGYLLKFANLFVDLPHEQPAFHYEKDRQAYCRTLFDHFEISRRVNEGDFLARSVASLVDHFSLTLREIERVFAIMALYYSSLPRNQLTNEFLIAMLSVLKLRHPELYQQLSKATVTDQRFFEITGLDKMQNEHGHGVAQDLVKDILDFCLMSDTELEKASQEAKRTEGARSDPARMAQWLVRSGMDRKRVIPFFCSRLDRFSLQPK